jgi:hypothetical protein
VVTLSEFPVARLEVDYPEQLDRFTTFVRLIWAIPIVVLSRVSRSGIGITGGLFAATMLMIVFRQRYPRWWFDFVGGCRLLGAKRGRKLVYVTRMTALGWTASIGLRQGITDTYRWYLGHHGADQGSDTR